MSTCDQQGGSQGSKRGSGWRKVRLECRADQGRAEGHRKGFGFYSSHLSAWGILRGKRHELIPVWASERRMDGRSLSRQLCGRGGKQ